VARHRRRGRAALASADAGVRALIANGAVPILPSRDLRETLAFYERLGFENRGAPPEEWDYLIIGRGDDWWLHFFSWPEVDPLTTSSSCYLYVDDADAVYEEWRGAVEPDPATGSRLEPPRTTDYRMREFALVDRNGNLIRVGSAAR
jgi:catechol 2,3-dioxygenase-like lactoylglutathione lyase family enzyme